jgi:hypothetical protein
MHVQTGPYKFSTLVGRENRIIMMMMMKMGIDSELNYY